MVIMDDDDKLAVGHGRSSTVCTVVCIARFLMADDAVL